MASFYDILLVYRELSRTSGLKDKTTPDRPGAENKINQQQT